MQIEVKNLYKSYDRTVLFKDFNILIQKGEFVALLGESGSGKTTLLNIMGLIEPFDKGSILYDSVEIKTMKQKRELLGSQVGFVFQDYGLITNVSIKHNFKFMKPNSISISEALDKVGLSYLELDRKIYTLSGGEQQRIALAKVIYKGASVIFADEATASVDSENKKMIMDILKVLNKEGKTIVFVTHDKSLVSYFDRIVHLEHHKGGV